MCCIDSIYIHYILGIYSRYIISTFEILSHTHIYLKCFMYLSVPTLLPPNSKFEYSRKNTELRIKKFNSSSHLCPYIILLFTLGHNFLTYMEKQ